MAINWFAAGMGFLACIDHLSGGEYQWAAITGLVFVVNLILATTYKQATS